MSVVTNMSMIFGLAPVTGDDVKRCPWLRKLPDQDKYICRIHECESLNIVELIPDQGNML